MSRETDKIHCQCQNKLQEISEHYGMSTSNYYIQKVRKSKKIMLKTQVIKTHLWRNIEREGSIPKSSCCSFRGLILFLVLMLGVSNVRSKGLNDLFWSLGGTSTCHTYTHKHKTKSLKKENIYKLNILILTNSTIIWYNLLFNKVLFLLLFYLYQKFPVKIARQMKLLINCKNVSN